MPAFEVGIQWEQPPVDLIAGSIDTDISVVQQTAELLDQFGVPYTARNISAHRTPHELDDYCSEVRVRDSELVIVAYAGMAAALGGDMAARVPNFVVGVPLLNGKDTMNASIAAQAMIPPGNGLTIVGPDQGVNAGLAALRALGTSHPEIRHSLMDYQGDNRHKAVEKDAKLRELGLQGYKDSLKK